MKKTFRQAIFFIFIICLVLLIAISSRLRVFSSNTAFNWISTVMNNSYFCGVFCSVLSVPFVNYFQNLYSKKMIKKDFRCDEIIFDLIQGIKLLEDLEVNSHLSLNNGKGGHNSKSLKAKGLNLWNFYRSHKFEIEEIQHCLTYHNNKVLIESVRSCFLINANFKLLNIINNIENRLPKVREGYCEIVELCANYERTNDDDLLIKIGYAIPLFISDLNYMALYWSELLGYLNVDVLYFLTFFDFIDKNFEMFELHRIILLPKEQQKTIFKSMCKKVKRLYLRNKLKNGLTKSNFAKKS